MTSRTSPQQAWAKRNPDKIRAIRRRYYEKHGQKIHEERRAYRAKNRERLDAQKRAWEKANPEKVSIARARQRVKKMNEKISRDLKHHYGITLDKYNEVLAAQNGVCAICRKLEITSRSNRLVVDHDHKTGKVRGLLCHRCNCGLGYFKDDRKLIAEAHKYLGCWDDE